MRDKSRLPSTALGRGAFLSGLVLLALGAPYSSSAEAAPNPREAATANNAPSLQGTTHLRGSADSGEASPGEQATATWETHASRPGQSGDDGLIPRPSGPEPSWSARLQMTTDPLTGDNCYETIYVPNDGDSTRDPAGPVAPLILGGSRAAGIPPPPCSGLQADPDAPVRRAAALIASRIDPASPTVQPGNQAVTGIRSHLHTNIDNRWDETVTITMFGTDFDVDVTVEGVHTIDWGDGTIDTGITGNGGPWHQGRPTSNDITHHYLTTGTHPLVVTTDWTVTATLGTTSATQTVTTTSLPVPITAVEIRSMRTD